MQSKMDSTEKHMAHKNEEKQNKNIIQCVGNTRRKQAQIT